jgi:hypothetical protein
VLKPYDASVIVLEGVPDRNTSMRLAGLLKPANFQLIQYGVFRGTSNAPVTRSIAVYGRKAAGAARSVEWKSSGQIDGGGGFYFSTLTAGTNVVCLYVAQFVDMAGARTNTRLAQLNAQKRELATQYLLHHSRWLEGCLANSNVTFVALGNLADGMGLWPGDGSTRILEQAGFPGNPLAPASDPASHPFPQVFARNASFVGVPQSAAPKGFGTGPLLYELTARPSAPRAAAMTAVVAPVAGATPAAAPVAGALLIFAALLVPFRILGARRNSKGLLPAKQAQNAVLVDFAPTEGAPAEAAPAAIAEGPPPAGELNDSADSTWQERARQAEQRANQATAVVREGLMPQFVRLMREKVLQRLSSQRAHLIDSHVAGTMQVLELEERLEKIQSQFNARLTAREQRVTELEKELGAKDKFIRELLKAQSKSGHRVSNE